MDSKCSGCWWMRHPEINKAHTVARLEGFKLVELPCMKCHQPAVFIQAVWSTEEKRKWNEIFDIVMRDRTLYIEDAQGGL